MTDQLLVTVLNCRYALAACNYFTDVYDARPLVGVDRLTGKVLEARHALEATRA